MNKQKRSLLKYIIEVNQMQVINFHADEDETDKGIMIVIKGKLDLIIKDYFLPLMITYIEGIETNLIFDLQQVEYLDSSGLSLILECANVLKEKTLILHVILKRNSQADRIFKLPNTDRQINKLYDISELPDLNKE